MKLWILVEKFKKYPDIYKIESPDLKNVGPHNWYIVRFIKYNPNKQKPLNVITVTRRYLHRDPVLSKREINLIEERFDIKIHNL